MGVVHAKNYFRCRSLPSFGERVGTHIMGVCFIFAEIAVLDNSVCVEREEMVNEVGDFPDG